ncbi:MAG: ArsR family transcriptional regulator [Haloarcula sp.]
MSNQGNGSPGDEQWCGMTPSDRRLSTTEIDDVFEVLSDWRRRAVCRYFSTCDGSAADVETIATAIANQGSMSAAVAAEMSSEAIQAQLETEHLPVLHQIGIIDYDERSGAVKYWGSPTVEKWAEHAQAVTQRTEL